MITFDTTERIIKRAPCDYTSLLLTIQFLITVIKVAVCNNAQKYAALCALLTIFCHKPAGEKLKDYN